MTVTRPVTTPNLHFAPPCAKSPPTTTTRHIETGVFQRRTKKRTAPRPQTAHRGQGAIATTRATCDVRAESRRVHWARRGRDGPAPQEHGVANWGRSSFRPSSARTAPFCVAITTATFPESRLSYVPFFRAMLRARVRRPAACAVYVADRPRSVTPDAAPERR